MISNVLPWQWRVSSYDLLYEELQYCNDNRYHTLTEDDIQKQTNKLKAEGYTPVPKEDITFLNTDDPIYYNEYVENRIPNDLGRYYGELKNGKRWVDKDFGFDRKNAHTFTMGLTAIKRYLNRPPKVPHVSFQPH